MFDLGIEQIMANIIPSKVKPVSQHKRSLLDSVLDDADDVTRYTSYGT